MPHPEPIITSISSLDWPTDDLEETVIQCAGKSYLAYESNLLNRRDFLYSSSFYKNGDGSAAANNDASNTSTDNNGEGGKKKEYDLLTMSERKLEKLSYYQVLARTLPIHAGADDIRKAYHRACLKYHPDKTGRGEEDEVFLLVKAAFDTLSDPMKRRSYDSTVDFDEAIPNEDADLWKGEDFYAEYRPVFERNLRFAACNDPAKQMSSKEENAANGKKGKNKNKKKGKNSSKNNGNGNAPSPNQKPVDFGDDSTSLAQVHAFYDFWIHFDSWRDFSLKAAKKADHDVESADCREEKRWMKNEIDRKMKKMKKDEVARVALLVERAMAADPRLKRDKERKGKEKREKEEAKKKAEEEKAEKDRVEKGKMDAEMAKKKAVDDSNKKDAKKIKEQQKKQLRKAKQLFRKLTMVAYQAANPNDSSESSVWGDLEMMNDDIELLCDKLTAMELSSLSDILGGAEVVEEGSTATICVGALSEVKQCAVETAAGAERQSLMAIASRNQARKDDADKAKEAKLAKASTPWSKEELGALAKAVKKYPPGGSNRWDAIALYVNNLCKQPDPRTKDECIEKYNLIAASKGPASAAPAVSAAPTEGVEGEWTEEQDALLQEMLRKHPADMDKNERWKSIAKGVPGKTKKDCVGRFKAIREAVKSGKK